ncbi:hypothetical protein [Mesomycoplasma hyorhinis]|uniref:hypothetical protein n=2 Tax=Mesomycoplasma hyorhinis TaxID=2100 RepID=UPI0003825BBF|nr:hypothetical protein [Mesomycoplasma hyorhinis]QPC29550.1 hypothetical protein ISX88_03155 [Mesomycoplasma hyorhinis]UVT32194.1 hypothetical protein NV227_03240 [Mesomycoplasma hyorhinis]UVT32871.1 hypothetical protein NV228_03150 [Mesomycoplasma hyorhinis]UVT33547.1 hypothetical protein NV229_03140 [Mesomycoplasma hyorhinis]
MILERKMKKIPPEAKSIFHCDSLVKKEYFKLGELQWVFTKPKIKINKIPKKRIKPWTASVQSTLLKPSKNVEITTTTITINSSK